MNMQTSLDGLTVIKYYESCRLKAYPDPATGGDPWTVGYGCTGPDIGPETVITLDEADAMLSDRLSSEFEPGVNRSLAIPITQRQFDALISFSYNVGLGNLRSSTLLRKLNLGDVSGASNEFLKWDLAAGKVMLGLQRRRTAEQALFNGYPAPQAIAMAEAITWH